MKFYPIIRDAWGQLQGYHRWTIRRLSTRAAKMSPDVVARKSLLLARERYLDAVRSFLAYADLVRRHTGVSDLASIPFDSLPILSKNDISQFLSHKESLLPPVQKAIRHSTGGSTGQPFRFYITRESYEWRTAVSDRGYSWALAEEGQRSFYVWGTAIHKPGWRQRIRESIHHGLQHRKYFDSFAFDDARKAECCRQINRFKPVSLVGYTGNLIELAQYVERHPGVLTWRAKTAVTAAEGLRPGMRAVMEAHLADEVFMSYGSREFMLIGMEGPDHDGYYISADNLYVEVVDEEGHACAPGETGRILVTDLHNTATPFIRYEIGDVGKEWGVEGEREFEQEVTKVGSPSTPFPRLASVEGRLQEVIELANGEKLTALFIPHLMKEFAWVDGYQVVQKAPGRIGVNLVTRDDGWEQKISEMERLLRAKLGENTEIDFRLVARLERLASGKTPIVLQVDKVAG